MPEDARPPGANRIPIIQRVLSPFQEFARAEVASGVLLLLCAVVALAWANSPWADSYTSLWQTPVSVGLGDGVLAKPLLLWINDGLMAVFFFVVGLEIKREILGGELASPRRAALPIAAALGGMVVPAALYAALNVGTVGAPGWGIPMATDIAFALGVLAVLGRRAPLALKLFLTALAIVDDLGAVLVIALFYTADIAWRSLAAGAGLLVMLVTANWVGVRSPLPYALLGVGLWLAFLLSGIHATVAGVLLALTIPGRARIDGKEFLTRGRALLDDFEHSGSCVTGSCTTENEQGILEDLEAVSERVQTPLQRLEHTLHPWVAFAVMPLFALANAGVILSGDVSAAAAHPVSLGVLLGLVVGKQVGITLFTWLAVRCGIATMPDGMSWRHIYGAAWLGGIGFTMSLFIAGLAFGGSPLLELAKLGILAASLISGIAGWLILVRLD